MAGGVILPKRAPEGQQIPAPCTTNTHIFANTARETRQQINAGSRAGTARSVRPWDYRDNPTACIISSFKEPTNPTCKGRERGEKMPGDSNLVDYGLAALDE